MGYGVYMNCAKMGDNDVLTTNKSRKTLEFALSATTGQMSKIYGIQGAYFE